MNKDNLRIRIVSVGFAILALAAFKPFGLEAWHWQAYIHLLCIFGLGIMVCLMSDLLMKYCFRMPCYTGDTGNISSIIHRNLYFQIVNTFLETVMICLYRHFVLSGQLPENLFSWSNFLETLVIMAFCSFAIGLYWRFKLRSKYLAYELKETKLLNEQLKRRQDEQDDNEAETSTVVLRGTTNEKVTVNIAELLYVEAVGNYAKICLWHDGQMKTEMLRATSKQIEDELKDFTSIIRCHRAFLVNISQVERVFSNSGNMQLKMFHCKEHVPVSRSHAQEVKKAIVI